MADKITPQQLQEEKYKYVILVLREASELDWRKII